MTVHDHPVRRFLLAGIGLPAVLTAVAVALQLIALPQLPDPVAVHWGASGTADGFAPAWTVPVATFALGFGVPAAISLCSLPGLLRGRHGPSHRLLGAVSTGVSALCAVLVTWTTLMQAGLPAAGEIPAIWAPLIVSSLLAVAAGASAWLLQPQPVPPQQETAHPPALPLGSTEQAAWFGETAITPLGAWLIGTAVVLVAGIALGAWLIGDQAVVAVLLTALTLVLLVLAATTLVFRVRVDHAGLTVASVLGVPRFRVPLAEIRSVRAVRIDPMGEFGGYGIRRAFGGRIGIVLRSGPAIETERQDGRRFVVTVEDAATGAALLQALAGRAEAGAPEEHGDGR